MTLTIELPDMLAAPLQAEAQALGVSLDCYVSRLVVRVFAPSMPVPTSADLIAAMQASPYKEICLEPNRSQFPVRDVTF